MARPKDAAAARRRLYPIIILAVGVFAVILFAGYTLFGSRRRALQSAPNDDADSNVDAAEVEDAPVLRRTAALAATGRDVDDVTQSRAVPATLDTLLRSNLGGVRRTAGPVHQGACREDLPGCCPRNPKHVLFFHSQKTGGSSVAEWLLANGKANGMRVMNKVESLKSNDYFCACSFLKKAAAGGSVFDEADVLTSHMSLLLLDVMRPEELDETLVIFSVRDPVARAISGYNYLRNVIKRPDVLAFKSISEWIVSEQEHAWDFRNGLATLLAHQQPGCRKDCGIPDSYAAPRSDLELMQQALLQLSRVCAVLVTEHMDESTAYLSHVLGWRASKPLQHINRTPKKDPVDGLSQALLSVANVADMGVYFEALQRVRLQQEVLTGGGSANGGAAVHPTPRKAKKQKKSENDSI